MLGDAAGFARRDLVLRMASSSEVLPWSTWPMTVTTGGRAAEVGVLGLEVGSSSSCRVGVLHPKANSVGEHADGLSLSIWVSVNISP